MKSTKAIYPGSFDPVTYGHLDVIKRSLKIFGSLIVAVSEDVKKETLFTPRERVNMLKRATKGLKGVSVCAFKGLIVDFVKAKKTPCVLVRGLRMISDFEYEFQMALTNRKINPQVETIFMMPSESYSYLSSKLIKEAASHGADLKGLIPSFVAKRLKKGLKEK